MHHYNVLLNKWPMCCSWMRHCGCMAIGAYVLSIYFWIKALVMLGLTFHAVLFLRIPTSCLQVVIRQTHSFTGTYIHYKCNYYMQYIKLYHVNHIIHGESYHSITLFAFYIAEYIVPSHTYIYSNCLTVFCWNNMFNFDIIVQWRCHWSEFPVLDWHFR